MAGKIMCCKNRNMINFKEVKEVSSILTVYKLTFLQKVFYKSLGYRHRLQMKFQLPLSSCVTMGNKNENNITQPCSWGY